MDRLFNGWLSMDHEDSSTTSPDSTGTPKSDITTPSAKSSKVESSKSSQSASSMDIAKDDSSTKSTLASMFRVNFMFNFDNEKQNASEEREEPPKEVSDQKSYSDTARAPYPLRSMSAESCVVTVLTDRQDEVYTLFMNDRRRRIDYILVQRLQDHSIRDSTRRRKFLISLKQIGLELENFVDLKHMLLFIKVHASWKTLTKFAGLLKYEMPIMEKEIQRGSDCNIVYGGQRLPRIPEMITAQFAMINEPLFLIEDQDSFFSPLQRSNIVHHILERIVFENRPKIRFGMRNLLRMNIFLQAYPLHSCPVRSPSENEKNSVFFDEANRNEYSTLRRDLYRTWGQINCVWYRMPLHHIRMYFGDGIGSFFGWVEMYNNMLKRLCIFVFANFLYGILNAMFDTEINEICDPSGPGNITMCPMCSKCPFWKLCEICDMTKMNSMLDNEVSYLCGLLFPLWGFVFIEKLKNQQEMLERSWHTRTHHSVGESARPEYLHTADCKEFDPITGLMESVISKQLRIQRLCWSIFFMFCALVSAIIAFIGTIRLDGFLRYYFLQIFNIDIITASKVAVFSSQLFNCICIVILDSIFIEMASFFTDYELPRTDSAWQQSFILKVFIFRLLNDSSYIFYVTFGRDIYYSYFYYSAETSVKDPLVLGRVGGLLETSLSLTTNIIGTSFARVIGRFAKEKLLQLFHSWKSPMSGSTSWQADYRLSHLRYIYLAQEFSAYILQYALLVCFATAFPFGAVCALVTNMILIRLTAYQFLVIFRRRAGIMHDVKYWFKIMEVVTTTGAIVNACLVTLKSDFIKRVVYKWYYSKDFSLEGFIYFANTAQNASGYTYALEDPNFKHETTCRYRGFQRSDAQHTRSITFWHVMAFRFLFLFLLLAILTIAYQFIKKGDQLCFHLEEQRNDSLSVDHLAGFQMVDYTPQVMETSTTRRQSYFPHMISSSSKKWTEYDSVSKRASSIEGISNLLDGTSKTTVASFSK